MSWGISILAALCLTVICVWEALPFAHRDAPSVVLLGDSIIANTLAGRGVSTYLEENLGEPVLKGGFGGSSAAAREQELYPASVQGVISLVSIKEAAIRGDFSVQRAQIAYGDRYFDIMRKTLDYFSEAAEQLARVDFAQVKYLVIEHGTNDYNGGIPLDDPQDRLNEGTFGGALRSTIEKLQNAYPDLQIILMTPTWCYIIREDTLLYCDEADFGGGYLEDYVELEKKIAAEYGIPVLDNYHDSGINRETAERFLQDGLHLTNEGQKLVADRLAALIRELEGR